MSTGVDARRTPTVQIVQSVADAKGVRPEQLTPLSSVLDPDSLNSVVDSLATRHEQVTGGVEFEYEDCRVLVDSDGRVDVEERSETSTDG